MQFKSILLLAIMAVLGFVATVAATTDASLCTPSVNQTTCILTYQTNAVSPAPNQGKVTIFSPSCDTWGVVTLSTNNPTSILAWGLSIKHPVLFAPIYDPALRYATPKFEYAGKIYGSSTCDCHGDPSGVGHACVCQFDCVPFMLDSEAKAAIDM